VRLGLVLPVGREAEAARLAEAAGCALVAVDTGAGEAFVAAAAVAVATRSTRIVVPVHLGADHPVTLAEDVAVLDNLCGGRTVALVDTGDLDAAAAAEDLDLLLAGLAARPVQHVGPRWRVPAGLPDHRAPDRIQVTPEPVQIEVPVWLRGAVAEDLDARHPRLATTLAAVDPTRRVQPGRFALGGRPDTLEADRDLVVAWAGAGATHAVVEVPDPAVALPVLARHLAPEVAMPEFPRVVAEAFTPPRWPGPARHVRWGPEEQR
jgi:alkanesulfonate monooxygenase SsuD/methylene tetrahydromethanopterin reductase-like flavin-dependent oxidoreductase (luciferase family)